MSKPNDQSSAAIDVSVCRRGCVHARFGSTTIHLSAEEFKLFMRAGLHALHELGPDGAAEGTAIRN